MTSDSMHIKTIFTKLMGVQHPIVSAPMALVAGGKLAAAVSNVGGLGLIGGGYGDADFLEKQFALADGATVGVGFISWSLAQNPKLLDLALAHRPVAVMLSFGEIDAFANKILASGSTLIAQVQTVQQAIEAKRSGAQVVVAQGTEAGGHGGLRATLPLVPAISDALQGTPVIAAGGIADGRGLAASLMLGASGVLMGSRYYASEESLAAVQAQHAAVRASGDQTMRSGVFDALRNRDWPSPYKLRTLQNSTTERWHDDIATLESQIEAEQLSFHIALQQNDYAVAPVIVGEATDLITKIESAAQITQRCIDEAIVCLQSPKHFSVLHAPEQ